MQQCLLSLKNYNKIWLKTEQLLKINFESKPVYGEDDEYIKKKNIYDGSVITNYLKKNHHLNVYQ